MKIERVMRWTVDDKTFESEESAQQYIRQRNGESALTDWFYNNTTLTAYASEEAAQTVIAHWAELKAIVEKTA